MSVVTLYFAGSGHGLSSEDDTIVDAYKKTKGAAMFLPGPGGKDANVYKKNFPVGLNLDNSHSSTGDKNAKSTGIFSSAFKRKSTGKGWNRNVFFALEAIADYLDRRAEHVTLNFAGHSRGSITVIMLLNDILHEHPSSKFTIASTIKGVKTYTQNDKRDFDDWYESRLEKLWSSRMGNSEEAAYGIDCLQTVMAAKNRLSINLFLFDPVGGLNQGKSSRKQEFPNHPCIERARVLRMETGGVVGTLSTHMPKFEGWYFLTGQHSKNLGLHSNHERYLIPLPGQHGAGLSSNSGKTDCQRYIGTSYMLGLLKESGTEFEQGFAEPFGLVDKLAKNYDELYEKNLDVAPGSKDSVMGSNARKDIHTHHTVDKDGFGSYLGEAVNAHHKHLNEMRTTRNPLHPANLTL